LRSVNNKGLPLTPVAGKESLIAASSILKGNHNKIDYGHIPSNVFTTPPLASVGLTELEAKKQGINYMVNYEEMTSWFSYKRLKEPIAGFKVLVNKDTDQIIGAHLLRHHAEDIINIFAVAMNGNITGGQLKKTIFLAFPELKRINIIICIICQVSQFIATKTLWNKKSMIL